MLKHCPDFLLKAECGVAVLRAGYIYPGYVEFANVVLSDERLVNFDLRSHRSLPSCMFALLAIATEACPRHSF